MPIDKYVIRYKELEDAEFHSLLSTKEIAKQLHVSVPMYYKYRNRNNCMTKPQAERLAKILNVPFEKLFLKVEKEFVNTSSGGLSSHTLSFTTEQLLTIKKTCKFMGITMEEFITNSADEKKNKK